MILHTEEGTGDAAVTVPTEIALNLKAANEDGSKRYDASARNRGQAGWDDGRRG